MVFSCCPILLPESVFLLRRALTFLLWCTSLKMTLPFRTFFQTCVCCAASPQIGRLLQQIRRLLLMLRKASSDVAECFFWRNLPKMRTASKFRIFGRSGTAAHVCTYLIVHTYIPHSSYVRVWYIMAALCKYRTHGLISTCAYLQNCKEICA